MGKLLLSCTLCLVGASAQTTDTSRGEANPKAPDRSAYEAFLRSYQRKPLNEWFGKEDTTGVKLKVIAVEGDDKPLAKPGDEFYWRRYGVAISEKGTESSFQYDGMGAKGSCCGHLSGDDLRRLHELLTDLPDDHSQLPPPNRRLVLQVPSGETVLVRMYDRVTLPDRILDILRIIDAPIKPWILTIKPTAEWKDSGYSRDGAVALTPDGAQIISAKAQGIRIWDSASHALLRDAYVNTCDRNSNPVWLDHLALSPDARLAVADLLGRLVLIGTHTWQCFAQVPAENPQDATLRPARFTPDGRFFLAQSDEPALRVFDTKTWRRMETLPGLPSGFTAYFPLANGKRALITLKTGENALWDLDAQRRIASLGSDGRIAQVALSPGEDRAAVATCRNDETSHWRCRIRIWNLAEGTWAGEVRPYEQEAETVESLHWSRDGRYLIGATSNEIRGPRHAGISVWSIETGRHRAELTGCAAGVLGVAVLADGSLVEGCGDGMIRTWDIRSIDAQIVEWEASLSARN
jgi:hypothetical protein